MTPSRLRRGAVALLLAVATGAGGLLLAGAGPARAATGMDPLGPAGLDLTDAFTLTKGAPSSVVAYVEGGINWHASNARDLVDAIYVNWRETPVPCAGTTVATATMVVGGRTRPCRRVFSRTVTDYAPAGTPVNATRWAGDPRVTDTNGNGLLDPEDLTVAFRDGVDEDHNGFPDDISGWDFYDHQPDPATVDSTYGHANSQMANIRTMCPACMILPIKAGAEALDETDTLAQAWLYAARMRVTVIDSVTADLGYSPYMRQAVEHAEAQGIAVTESSNDFDSTDHQGGMFWPGVVPGNGALADPTGTHWIRANETSWGPHNLFSIPGQSSTSAATSATGGLLGLLMAWGQQEHVAGVLRTPLTGDQAVQVLRATARPVTDTTLPWPGAPGDWSLQYGYGIPDLHAAMEAVAARQVPPAPAITSPDWYALTDPTTTASLPVSGTVDAPAGTRWRYELQLGLGGQPASFRTVSTGSGSGRFGGRVGTVDLRSIPTSFSEAPFAVSTDKSLPSADQYDLTIRLVVTDAAGRVGIDRRTVSAHHDPTLLPGFPRKLSGSAESQPALVDLTGSGRLDTVFATADGRVHAIDPASGRELPGWPVSTRPVAVRSPTPGVDPGHESVLADVAVGDLDHTGHLDVVATATAGRVYVWDAAGRLRPGWPRTVDTGVTPPPIPRPALRYTRLPTAGAIAAPVLVDLHAGHPGDTGRLDVVQAGWDGHLHAWDASGHELPGWPVRVTAPADPLPSGYSAVDDQKLDATPAVAYLDGPGKPPSLVERLQYTQITGSGVQSLGYGFVTAYDADGHVRPGWPVKLPSVVEYYGSAQEFITEGTSSAVAADVTGSGTDEVAVSSVFSLPLLLDGAGRLAGVYGGANPGLPALLAPGGLESVLFANGNLGGGVAFTTSGAFGKLGGTLRFAQASSGALSLINSELNDNSGAGITEYDDAYPATGGDASPGFPAARQGLDFLSAPSFADVDGSGQGDLLDGGDSNALHAFTPAGTAAAGFPKFTSGWTVFSPATGDLDGDGHTDLVTTTREGYLMAWRTAGTAAGNAEWWRWQHDERNTGRYGTVTRPPGAPRHLDWRPGRASATFTAPGDTWYDGTAAGYRVTFTGRGTRTVSVPAGGAAGSTARIGVPPGTVRLTVQAVNAAGLLGLPANA